MNRFSRTPSTLGLMIAIGLVALLQYRDNAGLLMWGANMPYEYIDGEYYRLLTSMFLHGGLVHVAMNLFGLYQLGTLYELMFGTRRFLFIYFVTGIAASITSMFRLVPPAYSVGASGAIFGILGAFIFSIRRSPLYRDMRSARGLVAQCVFWAIANIAIGLRIPQIDNAAHVGGLVAGLLLGALLPHRVPPPPPGHVVVDVRPQPYDE
jgi:rhomboid protease GluP